MKNANPSKLLHLLAYYNKGLLTRKELLRLRKEALRVNVFSGKQRTG